MSNSRFKTLDDGTIVELICKQTTIFYNPTDQTARVHFFGTPHVQIAGRYFGIDESQDFLDVSLSEHFARSTPGTFKDPVTGADLNQISLAGVAALVKIWYDVFHNEINAPVEEVPVEVPAP